jgi:hypothetical protein
MKNLSREKMKEYENKNLSSETRAKFLLSEMS